MKNRLSMTKAYWRMEVKRLVRMIPGALSLMLICLSLMAFLFVLLKNFWPQTLQIKPFQVGICIQEEKDIAVLLEGYIKELDTAKGLAEFTMVSEDALQEGLRTGNLQAGILMPSQTIQAIIASEQNPVKIYLADGGKESGSVQRYMEQKIVTILAREGAKYVQLPQAEDLLLYELAFEGINADELYQMERAVDLFHVGLFMNRLERFKLYSLQEIGDLSLKTYYLGAGLTVLMFLWGISFVAFLMDPVKQLRCMVARSGVSFGKQKMLKISVFGILYLPVILTTVIYVGNIGILPIMTLVSAMAVSQICILVIIAGSGSVAGFLAIFILFAEAFCSGAIVPNIFLPQKMIDLFGHSPFGLLQTLWWELLQGKERESLSFDTVSASLYMESLIWVVICLVVVLLLEKRNAGLEMKGEMR